MFPCTKCGTLAQTKQTRRVGRVMRRRYHCPNENCKHRFTTYEAAAPSGQAHKAIENATL